MVHLLGYYGDTDKIQILPTRDADVDIEYKAARENKMAGIEVERRE